MPPQTLFSQRHCITALAVCSLSDISEDCTQNGQRNDSNSFFISPRAVARALEFQQMLGTDMHITHTSEKITQPVSQAASPMGLTRHCPRCLRKECHHQYRDQRRDVELQSTT